MYCMSVDIKCLSLDPLFYANLTPNDLFFFIQSTPDDPLFLLGIKLQIFACILRNLTSFCQFYALYIPTIDKRRPGRPRTSYLRIMYKDYFGIMKEQCKNSRLPHLLMIVVHGETLWSPAPQPMDDDDDDDVNFNIKFDNSGLKLHFCMLNNPCFWSPHQKKMSFFVSPALAGKTHRDHFVH